MVDNQKKWCRFAYLIYAIFQPPKIKLYLGVNRLLACSLWLSRLQVVLLKMLFFIFKRRENSYFEWKRNILIEFVYWWSANIPVGSI